jgi:uncharacterized membrane protein (UPF0127 family)
MKKQFITVVIILIVGISYFFIHNTTSPRSSSVVKIGNCVIPVELAHSLTERAHGLSGRETLSRDSGMLFIFPQKDYQTFWMKGMNFDLDFIWIADDRVVEIMQNVPKPKGTLPDEALPVYRSTVPVEAMIEVNSGFVQKNGIKVNDKVNYELVE